MCVSSGREQSSHSIFVVERAPTRFVEGMSGYG